MLLTTVTILYLGLRTHSSYNWKFISFNQHLPILSPSSPDLLDYLLLFKSLIVLAFQANFSFYCSLPQFLFTHLYIDLHTASSSIVNLLALIFQISEKMYTLQNVLTFIFGSEPFLFPVETGVLWKDYSRFSCIFCFTLIVLAFVLDFSVLTVLTMLHVIGICCPSRWQYSTIKETHRFFCYTCTTGVPASIKMTFICQW